MPFKGTQTPLKEDCDLKKKKNTLKIAMAQIRKRVLLKYYYLKVTLELRTSALLVMKRCDEQ